jgi:hypothetical protein
MNTHTYSLIVAMILATGCRTQVTASAATPTSPRSQDEGGTCSSNANSVGRIEIYPSGSDELTVGKGIGSTVEPGSNTSWCCTSSSSKIFAFKTDNGPYSADYYESSQCSGDPIPAPNGSFEETVEPNERLDFCARITDSTTGQTTTVRSHGGDPIVKVAASNCGDDVDSSDKS